jgi:ankyrin repeat protein
MRRLCAAVGLVLFVGAATPAAPAEAEADTRLVQAIKAGDRAAVGQLVRQRENVNAAEADGTTPLHWAAQANDLEIVRTLLAAGADARTANRYGVTPLQLAAVNGNAATIDVLLKAGANPNAVLPEGETILMTAARTGQPDALNRLLEAGVDLRARERWFGETALIWAAAENHGTAVRALVERGADVNERSSRLDIAKRRSGQSILTLGYWTPMMYAARENALDAGRELVRLGADLNLADPDGATALVIAIINANYEFAALLIEAGADPNVVDTDAQMGPLYAAVDMHRLAIGHGRPNPRPAGALDSVDIVRMLLAHKANPNARLKAPILQRHHTGGDGALGAGATPFMRASKSGDVEVMRLLLAAGADPALTMPNRSSALMFASGLGWRDGSPAAPSFDQGSLEDAVAAIQLLIESGADINAANDNGETALHVAVTGRGSETIVRALIARGASLTAQNKRAQTPLAAATASRKDLSHLVEILRAAQ